MRKAGFSLPFAAVGLCLFAASVRADEPVHRLDTALDLAAAIDARLEKHWQNASATPAAPTDDAAFLRRVTLDLTGRPPTQREAVAFAEDKAADKRAAVIRRLIEGPEYPLHMGRTLDEMIQGKNAGDAEFLEYLRGAVASHRSWEQVFRDVLLGPWDAPERKGAQRFLVRRLNNLDDLANDTAIAFFGVNISCARCHDHPLVEDWKQDHYFGMVSFFNPTYEGNKGNRNKTNVTSMPEKKTAPVTFLTTKGERRTAKLMFLSGQVAEEPTAFDPKAPQANRREQLVTSALEEKKFFSKALVNRLWANLMGRGLVSPTDQMHAANKPAIPGLLDFLADDLVEHKYDIDRLMTALVASRVYQLSSVRPSEGDEVRAKDFSVAPLRSLTPAEYALALVIVTGDGSLDRAETPEARTKTYRNLEGQAAALLGSRSLDPRTDRYQASAGEALYMSNNAEVQKLVQPAGQNLTARLAAIDDPKKLVETLIWTIHGRAPTETERDVLGKWIEERKADRNKASAQLVWALLTSAEFRFNH